MKKVVGIAFSFFLAVFLIFLPQKSPRAQEKEIILDRPFGIERLRNGNILIADGGGRDWINKGSEIMEISSKGEIIWFFQDNLAFAHSVKMLTNGNFLIVDTVNNRLLEINRDKKIIWSSESWEKGKLTDGSRLNHPTDVEELANGNFLVVDQNNNRIIEIDRQGRVYWQKNNFNKPYDADFLQNGNILVSESENNKIIEIDSLGQVTWSYGGGEKSPLYGPSDADKLENGNYLITDTFHHRVIETTPEGKVEWEYKEFLSFPYEADRSENGNTLISDSSHARVIEVNPEGKIIWQFYNAPKIRYSSEFFGSFEEDGDNDGWPDGWLRGDLLAEGKGSFAWDKIVFKDGHHSVRIDNEGSEVAFWHRYYGVKRGKNYSLIGFIKSHNLEEYARFEVVFIDEFGGQVGTTDRTPDHRKTTQWVRYETIFTPPKGAIAADVRCLIKGRGTVWFDEIDLKPVGWQKLLGLKISLGILLGGIIIAFLLDKFVR